MEHSLIGNTAALRTALALLAVLSLAAAGHAADNDQTGNPKVDCNDPSDSICIECCLPNCPSGPGKIACCPGDLKDCEITPKSPTTAAFAGIHLVLSAGGAELTFDREWRKDGKSGREFFEVTVKEVFHTNTMRNYSFKARLTGEDASVASMLYAVAFLGLGEDAVDALQEAGYDAAIMGVAPSETCGAKFSAEACTALANQLSQGIDGAIRMGAAAEREAFLQGVQTLGFAPCQIILE